MKDCLQFLSLKCQAIVMIQCFQPDSEMLQQAVSSVTVSGNVTVPWWQAGSVYSGTRGEFSSSVSVSHDDVAG
jgi:hypothetical protein